MQLQRPASHCSRDRHRNLAGLRSRCRGGSGRKNKQTATAAAAATTTMRPSRLTWIATIPSIHTTLLRSCLSSFSSSSSSSSSSTSFFLKASPLPPPPPQPPSPQLRYHYYCSPHHCYYCYRYYRSCDRSHGPPPPNRFLSPTPTASSAPSRRRQSSITRAYRTDSMATHNQQQQQQQRQPYRYLAILDFEATCDDARKFSPQEIIEFPTVVIDAHQPDAPIAFEFHRYVRPVRHPILSAFCTELTGIQQHTVAAADPFPVVHAAFAQFVAEHGLTTANTLVVTCGDWDLKTMLPSQLTTSGIAPERSPLLLKTWCNIKKAFQALYNRPRQLGMDGMLQVAGLPLVGHHHSGIDDSRNIAAIARRMLQTGYVFVPTSGAASGPASASASAPAPETTTGAARVVPGLPSSAKQSPAAAKAARAAKAANGAGSVSNGSGSPAHAPAAAAPEAPRRKNPVRAPPPPLPDCGPLVDIGANLTHKPFHGSLDNLMPYLLEAKKAGVTGIVITGTNVTASREAIAICRAVKARVSASGEDVPDLKCTVGVHPHDATRALENPNLANTLESLVTSNRDVVAAVGECGLDYDRNFSAPSDQLKAFELQCELSLRVRLPLFLHERAAHEAFVGVLEKVNAKAASAAGAASNGVPSEAPWSALRGVLHCYTGEKADELARCVGLGLHFGITGWVVDERPGRGAGLAALVPSIPLDRLMVETDAPFLVPRNVKPTPKVNTPALLPHVAKAVADLYGMDAKEFGAATTRNAKAFFGL